MKNHVNSVAILVFLVALLASCVQQEPMEVIAERQQAVSTLQSPQAAQPEPECSCKLITRSQTFLIQVCGVKDANDICTPTALSCVNDPAPLGRDVVPANNDFEPVDGKPFQLTNPGSTTFSGVLKCNNTVTTTNNVGIPITLTPGQSKDYILDNNCAPTLCSPF